MIIVEGSGIAAAMMFTPPEVLVNRVAEVSVPVLKLKLSKKVFGLVLTEPSPDCGIRLIVNESPAIGGTAAKR